MQTPFYGVPMYAQSAYPQQALAPQPPQQHLPQLPAGWELLYDSAGRVYYGCPSRRHVQWKFPYEHVQAALAPAFASAALITKPLPESVSVSVPAQPDVEEVDAMDSRGVWYQAFIVKRDEKEALVHFSGWGKDTAEQIRLSDFSKRIRARSASTATGQLPIPSIAEVRKMFGVSPAVASKPLPGSVSVSVPAQPDVEEVDAMDSRGVWYQAFIVKRDEKEALVHFSGWGKDTAEQIRLSDFSKRIRARSASTATGQLPIPSIAEVRKMFGVSLVGTPGTMPPGWEILQDSSGKTYYGNREMKKVQWEHPSMGVSTGKHSMAAQHSWMGAVNQIMSLRLRGKKIAPETNAQLSGGNNNNFIQRFKMWGTLLSELFKVAMACLLSVFVPQNCPPSITFDKEVGASRAAP